MRSSCDAGEGGNGVPDRRRIDMATVGCNDVKPAVEDRKPEASEFSVFDSAEAALMGFRDSDVAPVGEVERPLSYPKVLDIMEDRNESNFSSKTDKICIVEKSSDCSICEVQDSPGTEKPGKYFYYDCPLYEETGFWIPVSVPPMTTTNFDDWDRGFGLSGGYFPEEEFSWHQLSGEDKEITMWDVVSEMFLVARSKVAALTSGDLQNYKMSWRSTNMLRESWKEMANTLRDTNVMNNKEILETEPPKWLADSAASVCILCNVRFHPIMCPRHHCRFCGGIYCNSCSKGRSLLPPKFRTVDPQRVCDICCARLEPVQPYLIDEVSRTSQLPTHDLTDLSTLRSWLNFPWGRTMEYEIYKAANTLHGYNKVGSLRPEKLIPDSILKQARGLAFLTVVKVGMMVTYNVGTGLVVARREDGSWSPPSAISSFGIGWGAQAGGELTDYIIVLRNKDAIKTFGGNAHLSLGAGLSAAIGIMGRAAEADLRAGDGGCAACYTYSCSKGAFVGCSLNGNMVATRVSENFHFYGAHVKASDILLGSMPRPAAAAKLYCALSDLYQKLEIQ